MYLNHIAHGFIFTLNDRNAHPLVGSICISIFLILSQSDLCLNGHLCRKPSQTPLSQQQLSPSSALQPCLIFLQSTCSDLILTQKTKQRRCWSSIHWRQASRVLYLLLPFPPTYRCFPLIVTEILGLRYSQISNGHNVFFSFREVQSMHISACKKG